jgi:hygromycin-B 7''-O-kinase
MELDLESVQRALGPALVGDRTAIAAVRCHGGTLSDVYRVTCMPGPDVILKIYPEAHQWMLDKEVHVYGLLRRVPDVPFPAVLWAETAGARLSRGYLVLEYLPGVALSTLAGELASGDVQRVYRRIGAILRAIHEIKLDAFGYLTTRIVDPHPSNAAYMRHEFERHLAGFRKRGGPPAIASALEALVEASGAALGVCAEPVLCHDDLHDANVLVERVGAELAVTGVLDVENAVAADPLLDLARTLYCSVRDHGVKRAALFEGYGDLGPAAAERLRLYSAHQALELWCWFASEGRSADTLNSIAADLARFADGAPPGA